MNISQYENIIIEVCFCDKSGNYVSYEGISEEDVTGFDLQVPIYIEILELHRRIGKAIKSLVKPEYFKGGNAKFGLYSGRMDPLSGIIQDLSPLQYDNDYRLVDYKMLDGSVVYCVIQV